MNRKPIILLSLCSCAIAFAFYYFVPTFWKLNFDWKIITGDDISMERVEQYHQQWKENINNMNLENFVKEQECVLNTNSWRCKYIASDYKSFKKIKNSALEDYVQISGWVDPIDIKRDLTRFTEQIEILKDSITQIDLELENLQEKIKPRKSQIENIVSTRDLFDHNAELRKRQIEIYELLLPSMDDTSELYRVYTQEALESKARLSEIQKEISILDKKINREASEWISIVELEEKRTQWLTDIKNLSMRIKELTQALETEHAGKAPHPRQYAFLLQESQITPMRSAVALLPGFLTSFFLLSNLYLFIAWFLQKRNLIHEERTMVEFEKSNP